MITQRDHPALQEFLHRSVWHHDHMMKTPSARSNTWKCVAFVSCEHKNRTEFFQSKVIICQPMTKNRELLLIWVGLLLDAKINFKYHLSVPSCSNKNEINEEIKKHKQGRADMRKQFKSYDKKQLQLAKKWRKISKERKIYKKRKKNQWRQTNKLPVLTRRRKYKFTVWSFVCLVGRSRSFKNNSSLLSNTVVTQHSGRGLHSREDHSSEEEDVVVMSHSEVT